MIVWRLRVLIFYAVISAVSILFFLIGLVPINIVNAKYDVKYKVASIFSHIFIWLVKIICGLQYKVEGLAKLPKRPCIVMSNHQSFWDNVFMQLIIPKHSWIVKKELFNIPFWGWGLKILDPVAVDRSNYTSVKQIVEGGIRKIKSGLWLIVFPEATRLRPEQHTKFRPSAAKLAIAAKVPIVLIAHNAGVYWPKGFWIQKPGTIKVKVVEVLTEKVIENYEVRSLTDYIEKTINAEKQKLFESAGGKPLKNMMHVVKF